jgi:L-lactate utilization protein LutB
MKNVALSLAVVLREKNVNLFAILETALLELIVQLATTEKPVLVGFH